MRKRILFTLCAVGILSGCGGEEISVVKLDHMPAQWDVRDMNSNSFETGPETWANDLLRACTDDPIPRIHEDVTVYHSYALNRKAMISDYDAHAYKLVTYVKGQQNYVICQDGFSPKMRVGLIEELPSFVQASKGVTIPTVPTIGVGTREHEERVKGSDYSDIFEVPVHLVDGTMIQVTPSLNGSITLTIGEDEGIFPLSIIEPYNAQMGVVTIALGYDEQSKEAYFFAESEGGLLSYDPIVTMTETDYFQPKQFEGLQVERVLQADSLEPGVETPLYTFSFMENGKRVTKDVRLTYTDGEFLTDESVGADIESNINVPSGPFVFVHKSPLDGKATIDYPNVLRAAGIDMSDLMDAIDEAEPVKRAGDVGAYSLLTIIDGWKGQEFQLSFKKRSKKVDVYLTDPTREQTFKLSSKGAETFFSYFPDLKE
ncbi:hypothetical protein PJK55_03150 [Exiguobacterium sp. MMG028]|uniref:hypothetical protein n=1 Tax=Exiguobacterium sp. MMG028 TaxID=3021979 RepID=UPI0022FF2C5A|nr:hypothetical protein [Exiguobacterium sp. MMG028]MDA5559720.1 hypothetical protein [Exiguobacterium sp. MMG028]